MGKTFVFIGPSAPHNARLRFAEFDFQPPVRRGDLLRLLYGSPTAFAIVDGYFSEQPAVLHKEILEAIREGVTVAGAASMGALRAAELERFGMVGVGCIFAAYAQGRLTGDDEVAIQHAPDEMGFKPLTFAIVNLRATLDAAESAGRLDRETARQVLRLGSALTMPERRVELLIKGVAESELDRDRRQAAIEILKGPWIDQKQRDAELLLQRMHSGDLRAPCSTTLPQRETCWLHLHALSYGHAGRDRVSDMDLWAVAKLLIPAYPELHAEVIRTIWLAQRCEANEIDDDPYPALPAPSRAQLEKRGVRKSDFLAWMRVNCRALAGRARGMYHIDDLALWRDPFGRLPGRFLVTRLKLSPLYAQTADLAAQICDINHRYSERYVGFAPARIDPVFLVEEFMARSGLSSGQLDAYINDRGFENVDDLVYALQLTYLYRKSNYETGRRL